MAALLALLAVAATPAPARADWVRVDTRNFIVYGEQRREPGARGGGGVRAVPRGAGARHPRRVDAGGGADDRRDLRLAAQLRTVPAALQRQAGLAQRLLLLERGRERRRVRRRRPRRVAAHDLSRGTSTSSSSTRSTARRRGSTRGWRSTTAPSVSRTAAAAPCSAARSRPTCSSSAARSSCRSTSCWR